MIHQHIVHLFKENLLLDTGFLMDPPGELSMYGARNDGPYTAATLPEGVSICPDLNMRHEFAPPAARQSAREALLRYGYPIFEIDIAPWPVIFTAGDRPTRIRG